MYVCVRNLLLLLLCVYTGGNLSHCHGITHTVQNLFEQFKKKANFYFLMIAILSTTPFSPKTPIVSIAPLVFVLTVSAVKEAIEDRVSAVDIMSTCDVTLG